MKLILYEIKKILRTKVSILLVLFILLYSGLFPILYIKQYKSYYDVNYRELLKVYQMNENMEISEDTPDSSDADLYADYNIEMQKYYDILDNSIDYVLVARHYRKTGYCSPIGINELTENSYETISINKINITLSEYQDNKNSYEYRNLYKQKTMMDNSGEPQLVFTDFWAIFDDIEKIAVIIYSVFLVIIISGVFSQEYTSNMHMIILSSELGKKKIVKYKILASSMIGVSGVIIINLLIGCICILFGSYEGFDAKLCNLSIYFSYAPYNITVWQYFILKILIQCLSIEVLTLIISYFSLKFVKVFLVILFGYLVTFFGFIIKTLVGYDTFFSYLSIAYGLYTSNVFYKYKGFNIFGQPIIYPVVYIALTFIAPFLLYRLINVKYTKGKYKIYKNT